MSYREEDGQIVLTMSVDDFERLLIVLGIALSASMNGRGMIGMREILVLSNRLNEGNPHYTPYQVETKS